MPYSQPLRGADYQTPDEVVTDPEPSRTVVVRRTNVRKGHKPSIVLQIYAPVNAPIKKDVLRGASTPRSFMPLVAGVPLSNPRSILPVWGPPDMAVSDTPDTGPLDTEQDREALSSPLCKH